MLVHSRHDGAQIISQLEKKSIFCWKNSNHLSCFDNGELKVELKLAWQNSLCLPGNLMALTRDFDTLFSKPIQ